MKIYRISGTFGFDPELAKELGIRGPRQMDYLSGLTPEEKEALDKDVDEWKENGWKKHPRYAPQAKVKEKGAKAKPQQQQQQPPSIHPKF